ncbi:MAG: helix-turn-helix domain-containing protein, partial [Planctomycetota bacterium]
GSRLVTESPYALKLVLLLEGSFTQHVRGAPAFAYRSGDLAIVPGPCRQELEPLHRGVDVRMHALRIVFDDEQVHQARQAGATRPESSFAHFVAHHCQQVRCLPDFLDASVQECLSRIRREAEDLHPGFRHMVAGCLREITVRAVRRLVVPRPERVDRPLDRAELLVQAARDFLHTHFRADFSLRDIASDLGVSGEHLARVFKRLTGMSVLQYREQLRLEQAKSLLVGGGDDIGSIASAVGYASANRFGIRFKAYTGMSPSAWRGRHGGASHAEPSTVRW